MNVAAGPDIADLTFLEHLGEGGYSDVYLYERRSPRMKVAVKVLKDGRLSPPELAQFEAEAETMAELADHPYIVQVFSADKTVDGRPYLVMKFYPRPNLAKRAASERFPVAEVLRTGVKIASAVETAHRVGITHRDIKPANILVSQYGEPGLTDFGIAGRATDEVDDDVGVSIPWSSPEVLSGESNGTAQSDVYSLAATLWHLLVGRSPFEIAGSQDNTAHALVQRVLHAPPPATGRADVPPSLERLLQQSMAKKPALRPRTALEFAQTLQGVEQEQRLARTDIVIEDLSGSAPAMRGGEGNETRIRTPPRVVAQPPRSKSSHFAPPVAREDTAQVGEPPTRARPLRSTGQPLARAESPRRRDRMLLEAPAIASTVNRPTPVAAEAAVPSAAARRGVRLRNIAMIGSAVVVGAVVVGVVLAGGSGEGKQASAIPTPAATDQTQPPQVIAVPAVRASYDNARKTVRFTWSVSGAQEGDSYLWSPAGSLQDAHRVGVAHTSIRSTSPTKTCIQVRYLPAGAGTSSEASDPVCGPRS